MKKLILVLIFFCLSISPAIAQNTEDINIKNLVTSMYNSSVLIFAIGDNGSATCSGVVIKNDTSKVEILTAKHCSDTFEEIYVENILVNYSIESSNDDLALLILSQTIPNKSAVTFASRNAKRNETVFHMGFPNTKIYATVGEVWVSTFDHNYAKMTVYPGCSGGGIYNEKGELVGDAFALMELGDGITVYEPLSDIIIFLKTIGRYNE